MDGLDLALVWTRALEALPGDLPPQHRAWLSMTRPLALVEDTALLATPNEFAKDVLENRLRPLITQVLSTQLGRDIRVAVTVQPDSSASADRPADGEAHPYRFVDLVAMLQMQDHTRPSGTVTAPDGRCELFSPPHPVSGRQHDCRGQTATWARPLRRRDERIARPARVRMRSRKPCFLCRRRLFG